jgi:hypothetical protein
VTAFSSAPGVDELEKRMRPGAVSRVGFLGPHETLGAVMAADEAALHQIGVTIGVLASELEALIAAANASPSRKTTVAEVYRVELQQYLGPQICPWSSDLRYPQCVGRGSIYASIDWKIENLRTGQTMTGPGLIVHLMHDHHFCEGFASPYRVDPVRLAQLLNLTSLG